MNELLLTPEEILGLEDKIRKEGIENGIQPVNNALLTEAQECIQHLEWNQYLCQSQLDKVLKWMDEPCIEHKIDTGIIIRPYYEHPDTHNLYYSYHKDCPECWQRAIVPE